MGAEKQVLSAVAGNVDEAVDFPLEVPILPFPVEEVLLPGQSAACCPTNPQNTCA
jgi:hypothetical protein